VPDKTDKIALNISSENAQKLLHELANDQSQLRNALRKNPKQTLKDEFGIEVEADALPDEIKLPDAADVQKLLTKPEWVEGGG
jgi:hypothetical protein